MFYCKIVEDVTDFKYKKKGYSEKCIFFLPERDKQFL